MQRTNWLLVVVGGGWVRSSEMGESDQKERNENIKQDIENLNLK